MSGVVRLGDVCTGHGPFPPRKVDTASGDVTVNGRGAVTVGSHWVSHCSPSSCHDSNSSEGSSTVFVNGKPLVRKGDAISCGSKASSCSSDVTSG